MGFETLLKKINDEREKLSKEDLVAILWASPMEKEMLYKQANAVRSRVMGDEVHLRGIIEFSNHCTENCLYCGLRKGNRILSRYRMEPGEILEAAREAAKWGLKTIVLQSGQDPYYTGEILSRLVFEIKSRLDVAVTLSLGIRSREDLMQLKKAGADRYLMKHETADPELFAAMRPGTTFKDRLNCIHTLKELGYQVGSGNMVGLPGQTTATLARDLILLRDLDVEMAGIGPFVPNPATPLGGSPAGSVDVTLTVLAVARLLLPMAHLPATTALETMHKQGRRLALECGANVIMPNVTPLKYRRDYAIYPNKAGCKLEPRDSVIEIRRLVENVGRRIGEGYGHSPKFPG